MEHVNVRYRGYLPHWERDGASYFITFRLADSLPKDAIERIASERRSIIETARQAGRDLTVTEKQHLAHVKALWTERYLDKGAGDCFLARPAIARIMAGALQHFDEKRYNLLAWCVMPNHVHVLIGLLPGQELAAIVHSWKSFVAKKSNATLGRTGEFWQREYYDHLVRNQGDLERVDRYILENPLKARLRNWPWVWTRPLIMVDMR